MHWIVVNITHAMGNISTQPYKFVFYRQGYVVLIKGIL